MTDPELVHSGEICARGKGHLRRNDDEIAALISRGVQEVGYRRAGEIGECCDSRTAIGKRDEDRPEVGSVDGRTIRVDQAVHHEVVAIPGRIAVLAHRGVVRITNCNEGQGADTACSRGGSGNAESSTTDGEY